MKSSTGIGQIAGEADTVPGVRSPHAFRWEGGAPTDLGTLGGKISHAYGINASGWVVGQADTPTGAAHACLWQGGAATDLGHGCEHGTRGTPSQLA